MQSVEEFLQSGLRNSWITVGDYDLQVYVRRSFRVVDGSRFNNVLDIANVYVKRELRGKGLFTKFLQQSELSATNHHCSLMYVESIQNKRLMPFLERQGYTSFNSGETDNMYKILQQ